MRYEVIHKFEDLQDNRHLYAVGDSFPRSGLNVKDERLKELSGRNNRQRKPLIKLVEDNEPLPFTDEDITFETQADKSYTKTEINRMSTAELQQLAESEGIENARSKNGGELKKILIEKFGL